MRPAYITATRAATLRHDSEIVGDENHGEAEIALQLREKFEDLFLHGDVERGGRFIGDENARPGREGHGDHGALAQAAGKLMRILARAQFGLGHRGAFERGNGATTRSAAPSFGSCDANGFFDLRADAQHGIERGHRLLKNHGDFAATHGAHFARRGGDEIDASVCAPRSKCDPSPVRLLGPPRDDGGAACGVGPGRLRGTSARVKQGLAAAARAGRRERQSASDSIVLPEPDSPTMPSVSPSQA